MDLMKMMDKVNELSLNRFNVGVKIAYGFIVVNVLWLIVGYVGFYQNSIVAFLD